VTLSLFRRFRQRRGAAGTAGWRAASGIDNQRQPNSRILTFPPVSALLDEDARLCSLSVFDAFRLLQELVTVPPDEREAMFFGGLFAYDLVAGFEDLPPLESDTACPDYCFYLAETLLVIDHQTKIPASRRACSPRWRVKNSV
jgi:anthranilate synthase component 1